MHTHTPPISYPNSSFILYKLVTESEELPPKNSSLYNASEGSIKQIFMWLELAPLLELMYHIIGIQKMKTHIFIGMLINLWILFGVIRFNQEVSRLQQSRVLIFL